MAAVGNQLLVFGGFHDNGIHYRYHNDLYMFSIDDRKWTKLTVVGTVFLLLLFLCHKLGDKLLHDIECNCISPISSTNV